MASGPPGGGLPGSPGGSGAPAGSAPFDAAPGQFSGPPPEVLAALPHDNAATKLNIVIWALNGVSAVFLALRLYCKTYRGRKLWWDDYILLVSWVSCPISKPRCLYRVDRREV